jgi:DNA-binding phage protein
MKKSKKQLSLEERKSLLLMGIEQSIEKYLKDICDEKNTPYLCEYKQSAQGKKNIVKFVLEEMLYNEMTIGDALREKERILDPKFISD